MRAALELCLFEEGWSANLAGWFLRLPIRATREPYEIMESWGFTFHERSIHLNWGRHCKVINLPWDFRHVRCEVMRPDGTLTKPAHEYSPPFTDGRWVGVFDYRYTLKDGTVQERTATVYAEEREWRWRMVPGLRWLAALPYFKRVRRSIDYTFSDEVGERTGSWKGGCISSGEEMLPGETPEQTFRRMERERVFD
jgi:hypothetical protein